ncbi:MAG: DUF937 domain-containing protein, partial [Bacteroidota bacterium]
REQVKRFKLFFTRYLLTYNHFKFKTNIMVANLLKELQDNMGDQLVKQASSFLGAGESQVGAALSGILPTVLGGLAKTASSGSGASAIFDMLKRNNMDGSMLNNIGSVFGNSNQSSKMMDLGGTLLNMVLGGQRQQSSIIDMIANFSGLKKSATGSLMSMAAPILMNFIGRKVLGKGMGASGLASLLLGQKDFIKSALPAGLSGISDTLGLNAIGNNQPRVAATTAKKEGGRGWLVPVLLGALGIIGLLYLLRGCGGTGIDVVDNAADNVLDKTEQVAKTAKDGATGAVAATGDALKDGAGAVAEGAGNLAEGAKDMAGKAGEMAGNALDATTKAAREALSSITFATGSAGEKMANFFKTEAAEASFTFENLTFATGSAELEPTSIQYLDQLAAILKAYPSASVVITGHTDNTGNAAKNEALSLARATSVKTYLEGKGIAAERMATVGKGGTAPTADNATAEGRAKNRRIEVQVKR